MQQLVYLNGEILDERDARVHVNDRGFLLADGIYEVIRVYGGRPFELDRHLRRLERSARELRLALDPPADEIGRVGAELIDRNGLADATIYIQVTRGVAPRTHAFPIATIKPTTYVAVRPALAPPPELVRDGAAAITLPDDRWGRCDVKVVGLTANVLAKQAAVDVGAFEAIFVRDGYVTDCASCNVFAVFGSTLLTAPRTNYILWGITREVVLELARQDGIDVQELPFRVEQLRRADEIFVTGTSSEITPIVTLDGADVGSGRPGAVTQRLIELFGQRTRGQGVPQPVPGR
ncbi:MAG: D-amino-acid transaminase [Chloroflexota bacterium]|nr:D-amino-acid transaminase [Chloroflexota bacterium]